MQACCEERKWKDVLGLAVALGFLEHPFVVDRYRNGEEVPRHISWAETARGVVSYHRPIRAPLTSMDLSKFWSASFFSSFVYVSSGTMRWSSNVFLLFLLRRLRLSLLVRPVSSSSSSPSALMSSRSGSSLSESESERSAPDEDSSPSSAMWSERCRRCFFRSVLVGRVAPASEEERLRAAVCSSVMVGVGGWMSFAMLVRGCETRGPSSESRSEMELAEGRDGKVLRGNSFPGLSSGPWCVAVSCNCSQRVIRAPSEVMLLDGVHLIRFSLAAKPRRRKSRFPT